MIVLFGVIIARLFYIQVIHKEYYKNLGIGQYVATKFENQIRGTIYFSRQDGTLISAATMSNGYIISVKPLLINDPDNVYKKISEIYPIDHNLFYEKIKKIDDPYEEITHRVPKDIALKIEGLNINGISIARESWRNYPGGKNAAHVLGLVAYSGEFQQGVYGLERLFEKELINSNKNTTVNPFAAVFRNLGNDDNNRHDIVTTIEPEIQIALEKTINDVQTMYQSEGVGGIVIDPKTGEILAMAYTPSFDPNFPSEAEDESVFLNPAVSRVYEFGSIIKPLVVAGALDAGVINQETKFNDEGFIKVGVETIHNFDLKARGIVTIKEILGQSLNTGMVMIMQKLGPKNMRIYFKKFGLRDKTGIDLPSEINGLTSNLDSNREIEFAAASFGQGFAVTPVQVVRAFSALANSGIPVNPYVVKEIRTQDGDIIKSFEPSYLDPALKPETAKEISIVLTHVVDMSLQNGTLAFPHHSVAAKTGTAQMVGPDGKYSNDRYLHSMFAYIPASNPKYLVFLYNVYPKGVEYASASLSKPLFSYLQFLISYGTIKPDR
jgi:cell division protein FtsI/penicillin-binding protein 2